MSAPLANPERSWTHVTAPLERAEVETRIGATSEELTLLSGGLANRNVRVGRDRVLRILRDPAQLGKERALMSRPWAALRTPAVFATGADWLLLEYVAHEPLEDGATEGAAVGRALTEIHATTYAHIGWLAPDLSLREPLDDDGGCFAPRGYGEAELARSAPLFAPELRERIAAFLAHDPLAARDAVDVPVLSHCDFKASNLHWTPGGELLVLDWEFAWAGSRYIDIGQLLRWHPPAPFVAAFERAYRDGGGQLATDWRRFAEVVDLCALIGLLRNPAARTTDDVARRIVEIIEG